METTAVRTNTDVVKDAYGYFATGNIPALLNELTDDVKWIIPGPTNLLPWTGNRQGKQQVAEFFKLVSENIDFKKFEPREFIAQGDKVVALGYWESTAKPTGKTINGEWAMVFTFKNGKVSEHHEYADTYKSAEAFKK